MKGNDHFRMRLQERETQQKAGAPKGHVLQCGWRESARIHLASSQEKSKFEFARAFTRRVFRVVSARVQ